MNIVKLRLAVLEHLGDQCVECGYDISGPALQIDHSNGDGAEERRTNRSQNAHLRRVLADTAGRYQLLCANCNQIKRIEMAEHGTRTYSRSGVNVARVEKRCSRCGETKPVSEWHRNSARRDGLSVYCGTCTVANGAAAAKAMRTEVLSHLGGRCADCGYHADERALQIDHVDGGGAAARKTAAGRGHAFLRAVLQDDGSRFQLLCANCNAIKRAEMKEYRPRSSYVRSPVERRPTKRYLDSGQIAELARLVAVEGVPQAEVAKRYGISVSVVSSHTRSRYPDYNGRKVRAGRSFYHLKDRPA